jgi:hypothetical protein
MASQRSCPGEATRPAAANKWFSALARALACASLPFRIVERDTCCAEWRGYIPEFTKWAVHDMTSAANSAVGGRPPIFGRIASLAVMRGTGLAAHEFVLLGVSLPDCWLRFDRAADPESRLFRRNSAAAFLGETQVEETIVVASRRDQLLPEVSTCTELCRVEIAQVKVPLRLNDLAGYLMGIGSLSSAYSLLQENCRFLARRLVLDLLQSFLSPLDSATSPADLNTDVSAVWKGARIKPSDLIAKLQRDRFGGRQQMEHKALAIASSAQGQHARQLINSGHPSAIPFCRALVAACPITLPVGRAEIEQADADSPAELGRLMTALDLLASALEKAEAFEEAISTSTRKLEAYRILAALTPNRTNAYWVHIPKALTTHAMRLQKAGLPENARAVFLESLDAARCRVALDPQNATGSLERLAHVASLLVIFHWEQQDFDAALAIAAESYEAHCRLCAVTPHYRRDLLLACNWLSHLRSVWISQEVVRISDGALRRVHRGYGGHADLIKQLDLVLEQPNNTSLDAAIESNLRGEQRCFQDHRNDTAALWLDLLQATLVTARIWRQAEDIFTLLWSSDCEVDISHAGLNGTLRTLTVVLSVLGVDRDYEHLVSLLGSNDAP